jgi:hypothetical protein
VAETDAFMLVVKTLWYVFTAGHRAMAIYITDRFGEVFAVYREAVGQTMPSVQEIVKWLTFINIQCPECGHPECPA